jgi:DNA-binding beta-propeller fold protein YncE
LLTIQGSAPNFSEIARFDVTVGAFIDHNPATPTIDAIGSMSSPPVAFAGSYASHIAVSGDGTHALVVGSYGTARLQSLTLDPRNPDAWSIATVSSSLGLGAILDVGFLPDPNLAVFTSQLNGRVTIFDVATDTIVATRTLASVTGDPLHLCLGR